MAASMDAAALTRSGSGWHKTSHYRGDDTDPGCMAERRRAEQPLGTQIYPRAVTVIGEVRGAGCLKTERVA